MIPLKSASFDRRLMLSSEQSLLFDVRVYKFEVDLLNETILYLWQDPARSGELPPAETRAWLGVRKSNIFSLLKEFRDLLGDTGSCIRDVSAR